MPAKPSEPKIADLHTAVRKLQAFGSLSQSEGQRFVGLLETPRRVMAGTDLVRLSGSPAASTCLIEGFAYGYALLEKGRAITAFKLAGDILDIQNFVLNRMDHAVAAITDCTVYSIPHEQLHAAINEFPNLGRLLWRDTLAEGLMTRRLLEGLGRKSASSRVAHLLCETFYRMRAAGLSREETIPFPFTQTILADAVGLSLVHVNRVIQELRHSSIIKLKQKSLTILDRKTLETIGEFEPTDLFP
jgi:CRP-like cAMP-binding protein